jgi:hypothetical protein
MSQPANLGVKVKRHPALGTLLAALACIGSARLSAQVPFGWQLYLIPDGNTVYDVVNHVTWLADANLAKALRFGLPLCVTSSEVPCVNASGSMNYGSAAAWVTAMNVANYLGTPTYCMAQSGTMDYASAGLFILNMNAYDNGAGYLGHTNWQLPPVPPTCPTYNCAGVSNPMGNLFL